MNEVTILHEQAMYFAHVAVVAKRSGMMDEAVVNLRQAMGLEAAAADMLLDRLDAEPSRSILYRSAAYLALECDDICRAEELVNRGLSGNAPEEIANELLEARYQVRSRKARMKGMESAGHE